MKQLKIEQEETASDSEKSKPVDCLGVTFENDDVRREYYLKKLQEGLDDLYSKLQDVPFISLDEAVERMKSVDKWPMGDDDRLKELAEKMQESARHGSSEDRKKDLLQLWKDEVGFPHGEVKDILNLSDPPYYTACPNPFIGDFIKEYSSPYDPDELYHREPFAVDVSEGKTDALYKAHSYHTKVPHLAIIPSILHYTKPGDIVLDGFCGSGMTGVAAQMCGTSDPKLRAKIEQKFRDYGLEKPEWGARRVVLNDLSPAATFISAGYNLPFDVDKFAREAQRILDEVEEELGWMYETLHVEPASSRLKEATNFKNIEPSNLYQGGRMPPPQINVGQASSQPQKKGIKEFTKRKDNLPHWQLPGAFYFITFNTFQGRQLKPESRDVILESFQFWHGQRLQFIAAVIMPDHVHAVIQPLEKDNEVWWDLSDLLHSIKSFSANQINKIEKTQGQSVWQSETYDHIIRDDREFGFILQYIAYNPVKMGLVKKPEDYSWFRTGSQVDGAGWKPAPLGRIEYTVWSEVFTCPECSGEVVFMEEAFDNETKRVKNEFPCPQCQTVLSKRSLERCYESRFDPVLNKTIETPKRDPSIIVYKIGKTRYEKKLDEFDKEVLRKIEDIPFPTEIPTAEIPPMHMTHQRAKMDRSGITHIHHFFLLRVAHVLATLWRKPNQIKDKRIKNLLLYFIEQSFWTMSLCNSYRPTGFSQVSQYMKGIYYIPSQHSELSPWYTLSGKLKRLIKVFVTGLLNQNSAFGSTSSTCYISLTNNSTDYIFTDPPFGENIYYADLNFLVESWHRVFTNTKPEAIIDKFKQKGLLEYHELMRQCFSEYYRVLKPGHWMTTVFHNSKNAVWNTIQEALQTAGFVVADVRTLDKQQGSYRQVTNDAVKQDLVISAYKPNNGLEQRFQLTAGTEDGAWDFILTYLSQLPVFVSKANQAEVIAERQNYLLYDRMVAFHVQRGIIVPLSATEFYAGLSERFPERDGMYFLPEQIPEYDKKRMKVSEIMQLSLFVTDEASAIIWLKQQLEKKPETFQEIHPQFLKVIIGGWSKAENPIELSTFLEQSFLRYDGTGPIPTQVVSWMKKSADLRKTIQNEIAAGNAREENTGLITQHLSLLTSAKDRWYVPDPNKAGDLEKLRERSLLKEFREYLESKQKRLKIFRLEAVRAGFKNAWQEKKYQLIIDVAQKIPDKILQEDQKLLMWYDQALIREGNKL